MKIEQCGAGHFFDRDKYGKCPFCSPKETSKRMVSPENTTANLRMKDSQYTDWKEASEASDENRTEREVQEQLIHHYTTGWLICVEGPEKGRDYRLRYGFNQIGRSHHMDVCIFEDDGISRKVHCSVVYEDKNNQFILVAGNGTVTLADNEILANPKPLHMGDRFKIGDTVLEFIPYCRDDIKWKK